MTESTKSTLEYAVELANISLDIGSIELNLEKPFTWASGYRMPIYNDNRRLLCRKEYRMIVGEAIRQVIYENKIECAILGATPTAGIPPAVNASIAMDKPICFIHDGAAYAFKKPSLEPLLDRIQKTRPKADVIAATMPFSIVPAIWLGNALDVPVVYVRPEPKDHGKQEQVEGHFRPGSDIFLLDYFYENSYALEACAALRKKGGKLLGTFQRDVTLLQECSILGKNIVQIEDLISTGGSSAEKAIELRMKGAIIEYCISVFSYQLDKAEESFKEAQLKPISILTYETLIHEAKKRNHISSEGLKSLEKWRSDPFGWGEKRGFPRILKQQ